MSQTIQEQSLALHKIKRGKISLKLKTPIKTKKQLSTVYTPGVGAVARYLAEHPQETDRYTWRGNCVAVISDGSAVLGLGNIGPEGAYPVMEGKCALFKRFADIDAVPIVLATQDPDKIIATVQAFAPSFAGINLEDIAAPKCFYIEETLKKTLAIPIIHDDQWGTAVVVLAGLINACHVVGKNIKTASIVVNGAGSAGSAVIKILHAYGCTNIIACDSRGIISKTNTSLTTEKKKIASYTNPYEKTGRLSEAVQGADILIGVSKAEAFSADLIRMMSQKPTVFALANPTPEIIPAEAKQAGAYIVATGRSDFPNQINNALAFPGIFRGALDASVKNITTQMLIQAAEHLASLVTTPTPQYIIPSVFDPQVVPTVAKAISR